MDGLTVILIAGPTGSGKSALAIEMARRVRGVIINADAMQTFSGLPILSAQPSATEQAEIPHKLYGIFEPSTLSSVGRWLNEAHCAIDEAQKQNLTPILVGGTGLYFRALLKGIASIPPIPPYIRDKIKNLYDDLGEELFRAKLVALDPDSAQRIARNDRQRLSRAYEVVSHTGKTLGFWQSHHTAILQADYQRHLVLPPRTKLYETCDKRFLRMMDMGALDEARAFLSRGIDPGKPVMKTIGLRELGSHLNGEYSLDEAIAKAQQATRNYAKRQMTWFRHQW